MRAPRKRLAIIAVAALALALAACGESSKSSSTASKPESAQGGQRAAGPAAPGIDQANSGTEGGKAAATPAPVDPAALQRSIIYDGSLQVRVDSVDTAAAQAQGIAIGAGGYVGGDNRVIDSQRSNAVMVLRVPAVKFASTIDALSRLGKETQRQVSTQDVTGQVIDVASRVKTQQASVDRIRTLLAQANSVAEIVSIESELTRREADLESLQAQQRNLSDLTALSTITLTLLGPETTTAVVVTHKDTGFVSGLKSGWHTFVSSAWVLLTILGALLPFLIVVGVPLTAWWLARRRRRQSTVALAAATMANRPAIPDPPEQS